MRGVLLRRHVTRCGILACRGGRPLPHIENRGTLVADNVSLFSGVRLEVGPGATMTLGKGTYLNRGVNVVCDREVRIGANCAISWDVVIMDTDQHLRDGVGGPPVPVVLEDDVWVGCRAIILKGVTIGRGAVIGAGAVVTRDVPPFSVAVGQPARVVRVLAAPSPALAGDTGRAEPAAQPDAGTEHKEQAELAGSAEQ